MNSLFSTFDPQSWFNLPWNWVSSLVIILMLPPIFWASNNQSTFVFNNMSQLVFKEFKAIFAPNSNYATLIAPISLFILILCNNSLGLIPYLFTASSHLTFTLALALPLWIGHMMMASLKTPRSVLAHLVPLGTPPILMPLMVLIELTSSIIRPITLSVRLAANMIAGHLLLSLMASPIYGLAFPIMGSVISGLILLCTLEVAVSMIQAYVFSVLSTLYLNEVNSFKMN